MTNDKSRKIKVAVGMSGGVDSSVAAKILKDQGYEVVGFMMKLWTENDGKCAKDNACCDIEGLHDAKRIAAILGIPFYVVDVRKKFKKEIADYFIEEYKNLRTPNPCVKCNEKIKFGWLLDFAKKVGCDYLATGHYARIASDLSFTNSQYSFNEKFKNDQIDENWKMVNGKYHLLRGEDENKDQSYFLYKLTQEQLKHVMFPVGEYAKEEVRAMAKEWGLPVYEKGESQEICFIKDKDYREFLKRHIPMNFFSSGEIVDSKGNILGKHDGLINYTIGQRKGIEQSIKSQKSGDKSPLYVIGFDVKNNRLIVGDDKDIYSDKMIVKDISFINSDLRSQISKLRNLTVKIRYRHQAVKVSNIEYQSSGKLLIKFDEPQRAITPGQSAVFYSGDEVLGGGIID